MVVMSCVYQILCTPTGDSYIGSSSMVYQRLGAHFYDLVGNRHKVVRMQELWNQYGAKSFIVNYLEEVDSGLENLVECERKWMLKLQPTLNEYECGVIKLRGLRPGARSQSAKLGAEDIPKIRALIAAKHTMASIAKQFDVTPGCISAIKAGVSWAHVP